MSFHKPVSYTHLDVYKRQAVSQESSQISGARLVAKVLARLGVRYMFGVVGIPVTALASHAQSEGIRYIGFHNEQAAGYAASAVGYLTGMPGVLLTVSGPGCVHGLAGLSHAQVNCWPMVMLSGSCASKNVSKGDFQELDQMTAVKPFVKYAGRPINISDICHVAEAAVKQSVEGRPGGTYVDLPADLLQGHVSTDEAEDLLRSINSITTVNSSSTGEGGGGVGVGGGGEGPFPGLIHAAAALLTSAERPLVVVGKGAAYARAEAEVRQLLATTGAPALATPMGKGIFPDSYDRSAAAARSLALKQCDVALVIGARLNWILHFGGPPRWDEKVKFILVDIDAEEIKKRNPAVGLAGDAKTVVRRILDELSKLGTAPLLDSHPWISAIQEKARANMGKMQRTLSKDVFPMNFHCSLRVIRDAIKSLGAPEPIIISEGANTMDVSRTVIEHEQPRTKLDAGTWGTMGVGIGYTIGAAVSDPSRLVIAIEGDSAFGFSAVEVECPE
ncbi:hypothetical protein CBR_g39223 [Chara braunii]|uniref:2-hydroxyacyl-CoA lyase n=1 Tax=Chara braunii TaxID=69332 RepID=A0A388LRB1_CHABU|nr:hypothetical protein CBR_g39223 [Chara braunii]|eukprot:GBG84847.1 hypothetical protein CBR_g39223 [Chara braunii]